MSSHLPTWGGPTKVTGRVLLEYYIMVEIRISAISGQKFRHWLRVAPHVCSPNPPLGDVICYMKSLCIYGSRPAVELNPKGITQGILLCRWSVCEQTQQAFTRIWIGRQAVSPVRLGGFMKPKRMSAVHRSVPAPSHTQNESQ